MSRKDAINSLFLKKVEGPASSQSPAKDPERVRTGAIGAMGTSLHELTQGARAAAKLQEQLSAGNHVVQIDPGLIDASPIADRLPSSEDPAFRELRQSISDHGQQVPILIRPSPAQEGRYQIAYGRRRLRAVEELGREVKAIVRTLSDEELVIAQGRENLDRSDLSFIEKALFAKHLEDAGFERNVIMAALSTDKADLSRYIAVARRIPEQLARQIGPAPKVGRSRWIKLADQLEKSAASDKIGAVSEEGRFRKASSDERFSLVLEALSPARKKPVKAQVWPGPQGKSAARIVRQGEQTSITFNEKHVPQFATFITERLDALYKEFTRTKEESE